LFKAKPDFDSSWRVPFMPDLLSEPWRRANGRFFDIATD
jgi:hypothetical protein